MWRAPARRGIDKHMHDAYTYTVTTNLRTANLIGALAVAVTDQMAPAVDSATGRGAMAPAALVTLHHSPDLWIGELARVLGLTHPGTVRLVDRLEADGLVVRRAASDGRAVALRLSPAGQQAARRVLAARAEVLERALSGFTAAETRQLTSFVARILGALTTDVDVADHMCRLCDERACPAATCPVEQAIIDER